MSDHINQRQKAFCEAYLASGNATDAAIKAGYSPRTARSIGQRLLTNVDIIQYLRKRNAEIMAKNTASLEEIYSFYTSMMRDSRAKNSDRLKAAENLHGALIMERDYKERLAAGRENPCKNLTEKELRKLANLSNEPV